MRKLRGALVKAHDLDLLVTICGERLQRCLDLILVTDLEEIRLKKAILVTDALFNLVLKVLRQLLSDLVHIVLHKVCNLHYAKLLSRLA